MRTSPAPIRNLDLSVKALERRLMQLNLKISQDDLLPGYNA